uniref:Uncharacterized protein n=1 Tax=Terrapene triunguis TaxID=2587831 RepID=A0A674I3U7_9SAUR
MQITGSLLIDFTVVDHALSTHQSLGSRGRHFSFLPSDDSVGSTAAPCPDALVSSNCFSAWPAACAVSCYFQHLWGVSDNIQKCQVCFVKCLIHLCLKDNHVNKITHCPSSACIIRGCRHSINEQVSCEVVNWPEKE